AALEGGARPVVGTTGWTTDDLTEAHRACQDAGLGAVIAPNFAIGAVLMMRFAAIAARHMPSVEIIELHHDAKLDAPSGTAAKTAALIQQARDEAGVGPSQPEGAPDFPARGLDEQGVRIHSVRLPGLLAHQETIFGGLGQTLSIRHDTISRESFMPGVLLACRKVMGLDGLVYGLDPLLD
ncbi:MAG: 4-hydroxy-tetrahydrodipicolinate reductase, partial [Armatimonadia bacterium]|nr:4-hydroxy-tetrahydrodipicolinate reductase [Armatimonadia bacterium]